MNAQTLSVTSVHRWHPKTGLKGFGSGCLLLLFFSISVFADTHYVSLSGSHTAPFTNWLTAATNIQAAIDVVEAGDTVLVTNGVYATGGAFAGGLTNRMAMTNAVTVQSVNGPAVTIIQGRGPKGAAAVRCAYVANGARLIGFMLTNGFTQTSSGNAGSGGGLYCDSAAGIVSNCTLTGNSADYGGAVYNGTLYNCALAGNSANYGGGAYYSTLYQCTLTGNLANDGGGAYNSTLYQCTLVGNRASYSRGGGAFGGTLYTCILTSNSASSSGGGVYNGTLNHCALTGNSAGASGGGASGGMLYNCTLTGNSASYGGGARDGTLYHCTLTGNSASDGGGAHNDTLYNCIAYYNTAPQNPNYSGSTLNYCCTLPMPSSGNGNFTNTPRLGGLTNPHLTQGSPCTDSGNNAYVFTAVDLDGEARTNGTRVDVGCDEFWANSCTGTLRVAILTPRGTNAVTGYPLSFQADIGGRPLTYVWRFGDGTSNANETVVSHAYESSGEYSVILETANLSGSMSATVTVRIVSMAEATRYVATHGNDAADGRSWATAKATIQAGVAAVTTPGGLVLVSNGVYATGGTFAASLTNRVVIPDAVTVRSVNGPEVTIIQGQGPRGNNAVRCVYVADGAKLIGFTLTNGFTQVSSGTSGSGGGIYCDSTAGIISNCILTGNSAYYGGGTSGGTLYNCMLTGNSAIFGGGVSYGTLYNCNCTNNSASSYGGGTFDSTLYNCTLTGNSATYGGGTSYGTLYNCTLTGNSASDAGGASYGVLYNCIVYYNTASTDSNYYGCTLTYSCTTPDPGGIGNITNDPRFVHAAAGNYRLQSISPCINAGIKQDWMIGATDLDGNPRLDTGGRVDMGAYEYQGITIWPNTMVPIVVDDGPDSAVELGVKFKSDVAGIIAGIRFYKAAANTGTHMGNLWTSTGTLLATATFVNETASGWQQALFATPVTITSNTVYVASYHANNGHYSADLNYFSGSGVDNPPLHALADGVSGGNGVYRYGTSSLFPDQIWNAANYWVDVVFLARPAPTLTSLALTPANSNIGIGATQQFTAMGTYSDGSTQNITSQAMWTSSNTAVATINAAGLATGVSTGTTTISATLAGVIGATTLTVQAAPLVITTTSLPNGVSNTVYTATLTASGGALPYTWTIIGGALPPGLTLNPGTGVISGTPTTSGTFSFTVQVSDSGSHTATKTLSITILSTPTVITLWPDTTVPGRVDEGPDSAVELGVKFKSDVAGTITGIRFYKATANTGVHVGNLWTSNGTRLATVTFSNESASGWQQALFATPLAITSNTVYVASYHANNGHYSADLNYFSGKGVDNPPLHALANGVSGGNGVYRYGTSSLFPNQTWNAANYWVDVVFLAGPAPTLTSLALTPANSNIGIGATQQFTAMGTYSDGSTQNITSQAMWTSSNTAVATINAAGLATGISTGTTTISATLAGVIGATTLTVQAAPLVITTTSLPNGVSNTVYTATLAASGGALPYTWTIIGGALPPGLTLNPGTGVISGTPTTSGTFSFTVQVSDSSSHTATKTLSITIMSAPAGITIWPSTAGPGVIDDGPDSAVELGVKFKSDMAGTITGIRFYKATANTGVHVGNLWASSGTRLATVTFSNETASGWQQALFATPLAIASNTVYVASYHANNGHYSGDLNYFSGKGVDNPPLHALANGVSGGNGVYRYGTSSLFPNQTWNAANYWVDVVFQPASPPPPLSSLPLIAAGENVEQWPLVWTSGDFSEECKASNLIDGDTNTLWIGNTGGEPWRVILDLGVVTDVTGIQLMFQDIAWTNKEIIGSRDSEVWFDYLAETNEWVPLRYLYVDFWGNERGAQPPAIREIIWRER